MISVPVKLSDIVNFCRKDDLIELIKLSQIRLDALSNPNLLTENEKSLIRSCVQENKEFKYYVEAIKSYRNRTSASLTEAKHICEAYRDQLIKEAKRGKLV
jgi:ribosomal protein L7/L12